MNGEVDVAISTVGVGMAAVAAGLTVTAACRTVAMMTALADAMVTVKEAEAQTKMLWAMVLPSTRAGLVPEATLTAAGPTMRRTKEATPVAEKMWIVDG